MEDPREQPNGHCAYCGGAFRRRQYIPEHRFCCRKHQHAALIRRAVGLPEAGGRSIQTVRCIQCRRDFLQRTITQRYCSNACRIAHGEAALQLIEAGVLVQDVAKQLGVAIGTVYQVMQTALEAKQQA